MKKVCSILSTILLALLMCLALAFVVPMLLGYQELAVLSGSMEPTIPVGSIVYVDKDAGAKDAAVGDIVTYYLDANTFVTHRIVSIDPQQQTLVTQGDANDVSDGDIAFDQVYGKVAFHLPYLGYISTNIRTSAGILSVTAIIVLIILLNFLPVLLHKEAPAVEAGSEGTEPPVDRK